MKHLNLTTEVKLFLGMILSLVLIIGAGVIFASRPAPTFTREELLPADAWTKGNASASAYLVEFSDFQCPACRTFKPAADAVVSKYKDKLVFAYRQFPLPSHPFSQKAAMAAEAAGEQGKFWEMYEYLFSNQEYFSDAFLGDAGKQLKLDEAKYKEAMDSKKFQSRIDKDQNDGTAFGVNATPTFFLNGQKLQLTSPADLETEVKKVIEG